MHRTYQTIICICAITQIACSTQQQNNKLIANKQKQQAIIPSVPPTPQHVLAKGPVATVLNHQISAVEYNKEAAYLDRYNQLYILKRAAKLVATTMAQNHIFEKSIQGKIKATQPEIDTLLQAAIKRAKVKTLEQLLLKNKVTKEHLINLIRRKIIQDKFIVKQYKIKITDAHCREYYERRRSYFNKEKKVEARHILILKNSKYTEKELFDQTMKIRMLAIKPGADFAKLAMKYSQGPSKRSGGRLGFFRKNTMVKPFSNAAFSMKKGEISQPIKTQFGHHLIKVTNIQPAQNLSFEQALPEIQQNLKNEKIQQHRKKFLGPYKITLHMENVRFKVPEDTKKP